MENVEKEQDYEPSYIPDEEELDDDSGVAEQPSAENEKQKAKKTPRSRRQKKASGKSHASYKEELEKLKEEASVLDEAERASKETCKEAERKAKETLKREIIKINERRAELRAKESELHAEFKGGLMDGVDEKQIANISGLVSQLEEKGTNLGFILSKLASTDLDEVMKLIEGQE